MVKDFDLKRGFAQQGDVIIIRMPSSVSVSQTDEISPENGRLVVLEGEMTGHHHSIDVLDRVVEDSTDSPGDVIRSKVNKALEGMMAKASQVTMPVVRMFKDMKAAQELQRLEILERTDLMVGILTVSGGVDGGTILKHQEHDGIRLPAGNYYIGRQVESVGAEERRVAD